MKMRKPIKGVTLGAVDKTGGIISLFFREFVSLTIASGSTFQSDVAVGRKDILKALVEP